VLPARGHADSLVSFCYFSASESGVDLMLSTVDPKGKRREKRLLRGGTSTRFESFHLFDNRPDVSKSGLIVLSSKQGGRDALMLVDSDRGRVVRRFDFRNLVAIHDPALAPDDQSVVFSGQDYGGRTDLYRVSWPEDRTRLERLTNDDFDDVEPDISPDGRWVAFSSDRGDRGGRYSLFRLSLAGETPPSPPVALNSGETAVSEASFALASSALAPADFVPAVPRPEALSEPPSGDDRQPVYSPDGEWIAFRSTRGGTSDLWVRPSVPSLEARRVTKLQGPASDPDWLSNGSGLLFTAQHEVLFRTYEVRFDPDTLAVEPESLPERIPVLPVAAYEDPSSRYERRLGFDLVQSAIGYDPSGGGAEPAGQLALSDVLGNEQIYIYVGNDADRYGNFWDGFQGSVTYINRARRLNWGVGLFRLTETYDADLDLVRREPRVGIQGLVSYPISKFTRVEGSVVVRHAQNHFYRSGQFGSADLVSNFASLVHDNTRWTWMGPSGGQRLFLSAGFTRDLAGSDGNYTTLRAEARQYAMPLPHVVSVTRVQAQSSGGADAQRYYMGGTFALRGYDRRSFAGFQTMLVQEELRLPLLRRLRLAVPGMSTLPYIGGAAFADAAWFVNGPTRMRAGSAGFGVYLLGGYYPAIRWNWVWLTHDFQQFTARPIMQFSIAYNF
jgi:hypothetical protein